ncbi:hypothetical protein [Vulcanisaeta distributa]|nr:hypothetical protein [Vulcanisaeta distributa]
MEVKDVIIRLGIVRDRYEMRLRDLLRNFTVPNWHPCPCPHGETERAIVEGHIEELARVGGKLLQPMIVLHLDSANYLIADVCIYNVLSTLPESMNYVLDRVRTEVWDLGKFSSEERYVAMAMATTICIAYKNRVLKEVKLHFARELIRNYVLNVAEMDWRGAEAMIEGLSRYEGVMGIARELANVLGMSERNAHRYIIAVLNEDFINELRSLVRNRVLQVKPGDNNVDRADVAENAVPTKASKNQLDISKRIYITQIAKRINVSTSELEDLSKLTQRNLATLTRRVRELSPEAGKSLVSRIIKAIRDNNMEEAVALIEKTPSDYGDNPSPVIAIDDFSDVHVESDRHRVYRLRVGDIECPEELCPVYRRVIRALKNSDLELLYEAMRALTRQMNRDELLWAIEKRLDNEDFRKLMNMIINDTNESMSRELLSLLETIIKGDQDNACKLIHEIIKS